MVNDDLKKLGLCREDALDRKRLRALIGLGIGNGLPKAMDVGDDDDGCLVPAHPGLPGYVP